MLMSALYVALDASFDYTISDMPYLRKWWCLLLMENFDLRSSGKLFAHWREEAKAVLEGQHVPIFRLKKRKFQEVRSQQLLKICVLLCSGLSKIRHFSVDT
ncbi:uncharacterized protein LOC112430586 [Maylandia zebra]|uniref:uncharacterized protein LOC112430586 n=1 Tax=Maylandia zebra TaxID=106582 RepID=UPI00403D1E7B